MDIKKAVSAGVAGALPLGISLALVGAAFYFLGNQPGVKQAQAGLSGLVSPAAPAALF